jgi:serine/threonine-protein phosphatase 6 regulatory ankyrin repeat subunit B
MRGIRGFCIAGLVLESLFSRIPAGQAAWYYHVKTGGTGGKPVQSETDPGLSNCWSSINAAFTALKSRSTPGPWVIQVDDERTYDEMVILSDLQTSSTETLTLTKAPWLRGRPTIHPRKLSQSAIAINGLWPGTGDALPDQPGQARRRVTYLTICGFVFKNNASGQDKATERHVFSDNQTYLSEGQHTVEDCLFEGDHQIYDSRSPILIYGTCINTVFRSNIVQNFTLNDTNKVDLFGRGHGCVFVMAEPVTNVADRPQAIVAGNIFQGNQGLVVCFTGDGDRRRYYSVLFERNQLLRNVSVRLPLMLLEQSGLSNLIRNNVFADNKGARETLLIANADNTKLYHNTFFNNHNQELNLYSGPMAGVEIKNNILWPTPGSLCFVIGRGTTGNPIWGNNGFYADFKNQGYPPAFGFSTNENLEVVGYSTQGGVGKWLTVDSLNSVSTNNTGNGYTLNGPGLRRDFRLAMDSLCMNRGIPALARDDVDGKPRPAGDGYDVGAHECDTTREDRSMEGKPEPLLEGQESPRDALLHSAAYAGDVVKMETLIREGARVDQLDRKGYAPLHYAVGNQQKPATALLLAKGSDKDIKGSHGRTPLFSAASGDREDVQFLLLKGANIRATNSHGQTPLFAAVEAGHKDIAELLLSKGADISIKDKDGQTVLHKAVRNNRQDLVELLTSLGADPNIRDNEDCTPLSCLFSATELFKQNPDLLKFLLNHGAGVNSTPKGDYPPLYYAIWDNNQDLVSLLLSKGADVNLTPKGEYPALHEAVWLEDSSLVKLLLDHGAKYDAKDQDGSTAFREAAAQGAMSILQLFAAKGADLSTLPIATCMGNLDRVKALLERGADINEPDELGWSPLYWAVSSGQTEVAGFLVARGANVQTKTKTGTTALHQIASRRQDTSTNTMKLAEILIAKGALVNAKDQKGSTPLHKAAQAGHKAMIELLLARGADAAIKDDNNHTALDLVILRTGRSEIVDILRKHQAKPN